MVESLISSLVRLMILLILPTARMFRICIPATLPSPSTYTSNPSDTQHCPTMGGNAGAQWVELEAYGPLPNEPE